MRHRKVISLYDLEPSHAEILTYLEAFEGRNQQTNALMQLLIVGHRVVANMESGAEAYYHARNPDVRKVKREPAPKKPQLAPPVPRPLPVEQESEAVLADQDIVIEEGEVIHPLPVRPRPAPIPMEYVEEGKPEQIDLDEVEDPLMKLQMLSGE